MFCLWEVGARRLSVFFPSRGPGHVSYSQGHQGLVSKHLEAPTQMQTTTSMTHHIWQDLFLLQFFLGLYTTSSTPLKTVSPPGEVEILGPATHWAFHGAPCCVNLAPVGLMPRQERIPRHPFFHGRSMGRTVYLPTFALEVQETTIKIIVPWNC